jgi:hypothetical protein
MIDPTYSFFEALAIQKRKRKAVGSETIPAMRITPAGM